MTRTVTPVMDDDFGDSQVQKLLDLRPWMEECDFILVRNIKQLEDFVDEAIEKGIVALDTETEGLNTRVGEDGRTIHEIVGFCLATHKDVGYYVPVKHLDLEYNLNENLVYEQIKRMCDNCKVVYHNYKFDGGMLSPRGIEVDDYRMYDDTFLLAYVLDASLMDKSLKGLSKNMLKREMIEIKELMSNNSQISFAAVHPKQAVYYAASDAMNTLMLREVLIEELKKVDPEGTNGLSMIYDVERMCQLVVMEMENNHVRIDVDYFRKLDVELTARIEACKQNIWKIVGHTFDINSPKQLGTVLFEEMKIPYPIKEKTASGQYQVSESVLDKVPEYPICAEVIKYRGLKKTHGTYIVNFLKNSDDKNEVKFRLNQAAADTGRFSASGGRGINEDGYSGVNCQNIPSNYDEGAVDIRKGIIARPGCKIVAIDYSGEELRIATNLSQEKKWLDEFLYGSADLHTITAKIAFQKTDISKMERNIGKSVNFLTLYGGGAGRLAETAKITFLHAKKILHNFFKELTGLSKWIDQEMKRSRKRGYAITAFGRRRPLYSFYESGVPGLIAKGDRISVNSAIQGCICPWERVLTSAGYLKIEDIDYEKSVDKNLRVWTGQRWCAFDVVDRGEWQHARIELVNGYTLDCDTRHEVLVVGDEGYEFCHFDKLDADTRVCTSLAEEKEFGAYPQKNLFFGGTSSTSKDISIGSEKSWEFIAYLTGVYTGDGVLRDIDGGARQSLTLCFGKEKIEKLLPPIEAGLQELGINTCKVRRVLSAKGESYQVTVASRALLDIFRYLGIPKENSHTKRVPELIWRFPLKMRKAYLRGYFDADGCKKRANRYSFHTPNKRLLQDVQLLGQTLGLSSRVNSFKSGTHRLDWTDLQRFERFLGIEVGKLSRTSAGKSLLPLWQNKVVYDRLKSAAPMDTPSDRTLLCRLNKGGSITVDMAVHLLKKYGQSIEGIYQNYRIRKKEALETSGNTYTLSVHHPSHRFDSAGIISKNTGADIMKLALYRVWRYVHDNGFEKEIRILLPIHDEIVYEIRTDKLDQHIPALSEIMKMDNIIKGRLKWAVGLDVDAEYGDTFHVDHDFFKEFKAGKRAEAPVDTENPPRERPDDAPSKSERDPEAQSEKVLEPTDTGSSSTEAAKIEKSENDPYTIMSLTDPESTNHEEPKAHPHDSEFFDYRLNKMSDISIKQTQLIWVILDKSLKWAQGPKKRVRIHTTNGSVVITTERKYPIDGFIALAIAYDL